MRTPRPLPEHITELQHMVRHAPRWVLPESIGYPPRAKASYELVSWIAALMSFGFVSPAVAHLPLPKPTVGVLLLASLLVLLVGWRYWWLTRQHLGSDPMDWRGCTVDVPLRAVTATPSSFNRRKAQYWELQPAADWSVGIVPLPTGSRSSASHSFLCAIELRHVRRGPVLELCNIYADRDGMRVRMAMDQLARDMAERLGVRFSGEGLVPTDRTRSLVR